jgi:hypothetical protein
MRTRLATLAGILCLLGAEIPHAAAEPTAMLPGVIETDRQSNVFLAVALSKIASDTLGDNHGSPPTKYDGWGYGMTVRGEAVSLATRYGGTFGATFDFDFFLVTPGAIAGPEEPAVSYVFLGFTPALALGVFKTESYSLALELGAPVNTDFYGLSAGGFGQIGWMYLGYRMRTGTGWRGQEVLDERLRFGIAGFDTDYTDKTFFGLEIIDGYSEDDKGNANLGSLFRGSYTMISLVVSAGR